MTLQVEAVTAPSYTFTPETKDEEIHVVFSGTGDLVAVEALGAFLNELREDVVRLEAPRLVLDLRQLYFINSSCLKAFVNLVFFLQEASPQTSVEFIADKKLSWQERAVSPLHRMSPKTVTITTT